MNTERRKRSGRSATSRRNRFASTLVWFAIITGAASAQVLPDAPAKQPARTSAYGDYDWIYRAGLVCGGGASVSSAAAKPGVQCGGVLGLAFFELEAGGMSATPDRGAPGAYLSTNAWIPVVRSKFPGRARGGLIAVGGYTQIFGASNALNYGVAYARSLDANHLVQFEARDYWTYASPGQHDVIFRIAWLTCIPDP